MIDITVVIPSYENINLFKKCLDSVLKQKGVDFLVIISDDSHSIDIREYVYGLKAPNIKYFKHNNVNRIAADNWNNGVSMCSSEWVVILHHDEEFINDDYLFKSIEKLRLNNSDMLISKIDRGVFRKHPLLEWLIQGGVRLSLVLPWSILIKNFIGPTSVVVVKRRNFIKFDSRLRWIVDQVWLFKMLQSNSAIFMESTEIAYNDNDQSITRGLDVFSAYKEDVEHLRNSDKMVYYLFIVKKCLFKLGI